MFSKIRKDAVQNKWMLNEYGLNTKRRGQSEKGTLKWISHVVNK